MVQRKKRNTGVYYVVPQIVRFQQVKAEGDQTQADCRDDQIVATQPGDKARGQEYRAQHTGIETQLVGVVKCEAEAHGIKPKRQGRQYGCQAKNIALGQLA